MIGRSASGSHLKLSKVNDLLGYRWSYTEPGPPQFGRPVHAIKVSNDGLVYVADRGNGRIQVFNLDGKYVKQLFINPGGVPGASALSPAATQ